VAVGKLIVFIGFYAFLSIKSGCFY